MNQPTIYTVAQINNYIGQILDRDPELADIFVQGEVSNITHHSSGHIYLTIKDEKSEIKAIMFNFKAKTLKFRLQEGMRIIARGSVKLYVPRAQYSLQIESLTLDGVGELYMQYEQLKQDLQRRGWFDQSIKQAIPKFPQNIGVVTAPTGAAIRDIIITIHRRYPVANIYLFPALVQGKEAQTDIVRNIQMANQFKVPLDVLIVGRGGGSIEDLWAFNELSVAQAIHDSRIPIISAVGHEIDTTIADFVADCRAATPTAAAELATPDIQELAKFLKEQFMKLIQLIKIKIDGYQVLLNNYMGNYHLTNLDWIYQEKAQRLALMKQQLLSLQTIFINNWTNIVHQSQNDLIQQIKERVNATVGEYQVLIGKLDILSPLKTISRGYSITTGAHGLIKTVEDIEPGALIRTQLIDGVVESSVQQILKEKIIDGQS